MNDTSPRTSGIVTASDNDRRLPRNWKELVAARTDVVIEDHDAFSRIT